MGHGIQINACNGRHADTTMHAASGSRDMPRHRTAVELLDLGLVHGKVRRELGNSSRNGLTAASLCDYPCTSTPYCSAWTWLVLLPFYAWIDAPFRWGKVGRNSRNLLYSYAPRSLLGELPVGSSERLFLQTALKGN